MSNTDNREQIANILRTGHHGIAETKVINKLEAYTQGLVREARLDELNHILFTDDAAQFSKWLTDRIAELSQDALAHSSSPTGSSEEEK